MLKLILNLFYDASSVVNVTTQTTSGYTMAPEMKTFYDTELLENARVASVYTQFGKKQSLPANHGKKVEWRKWNTFEKAASLSEGVIPSGQTFGVAKIDDDVAQYGTYTTISDELELRAYDDIILGATEEMGASAQATMESLCVASLMTNANAFYCDNINGSTVTTPTACSGLKNTTTNGFALLTPDMVSKIATKLKKAKAPTINGKYVAVIHPSIAYDLRKATDWVEAHKYAQPEELFNGEIGELHGVRFIENPDAPVCGGSTYKTGDNGVSYATFFFGKDAFGIIDPEGGNLEMIVHTKGEIGGPLNQFSTIGYKFTTNGATVLYPERIVRCMSASNYSASDTATYTG